MTKWIALLLFASTCWAQAPAAAPAKPAEPKAFYQLTFVVREMQDDRVVNARSYYATSGTGFRDPSFIRAGEKVPYVSSGEGPTTQWQQIDVGVIIDYDSFEIVGEKLSLRVSASIDSLASQAEKNVRQPIIRTNRWKSTVLVPLRQPTVIFSSDDPFSTQKMQLQLTVTPLR